MTKRHTDEVSVRIPRKAGNPEITFNDLCTRRNVSAQAICRWCNSLDGMQTYRTADSDKRATPSPSAGFSKTIADAVHAFQDARRPRRHQLSA